MLTSRGIHCSDKDLCLQVGVFIARTCFPGAKANCDCFTFRVIRYDPGCKIIAVGFGRIQDFSAGFNFGRFHILERDRKNLSVTI